MLQILLSLLILDIFILIAAIQAIIIVVLYAHNAASLE